MTRINRILALSIAPLAFAAFVQMPQAEPGFTSLFNGKDFTGWKLANPESFRIEDGAIVANGRAGHAFYDGPFRDHAFKNFELRVDVMTRAGSNGGIYILTGFQEQGFPLKGFEVQINNTYAADPVKTGSLYHVVDIGKPLAKDDEWFTMAIMVKETTISVKVNDVDAITWTQPADWNGTLRRDGTPEFSQRRIGNPGTIALQAHDPKSTVLYRNIRIRPLD
jgi:hypothetical protein